MTLSNFEILHFYSRYLFLKPWNLHIQNWLLTKTSQHPWQLNILDIGGRRSPYTIGIKAKITVSDIPRSGRDPNIPWEKLDLGFTEQIISDINQNRSNVSEIVIDDMTKTTLAPRSYDIISAVEVLEHIEDDDVFIKNVAKVLKLGGTYIMTTPNGDWVANNNPDHKRHYTHDALSDLLSKYFDDVNVYYTVKQDKILWLSLRSMKRRPWLAPFILLAKVISQLQSYSVQRKDFKRSFKLMAIASNPK